MRRIVVAVAVIGGLLGGLIAAPDPASAQLAPPSSTVTFVQALVDGPVDIYLDGGLVTDVDGLAPGEQLALTGPVDPGDHAVGVYAHVGPPPPDETARTDASLISQTLPVPPGVDLSVAAQSSPPTTSVNPTLVITPFVDDFTIAPGNARLSVRNVANTNPIDIYANGVKIITGLASGTKSDLIVPAGPTSIEAYPTGGTRGLRRVIDPISLDVQVDRLETIYIAGDLAEGPPLDVYTFDPVIWSRLELLHAVPGAAVGPVDVYLGPAGTDAVLVAAGLAPLDRTTVPGGPPGPTDVVVYEAVANPAPVASGRGGPGDALVLDAPGVALPANARLTASVGFGPGGTAELGLFTDDVAPAGIGRARVSVRHAADFGPVDAYVSGALVVADLPSGGQRDVVVPAPGALPAGAVVVVPTGADPNDPVTPRITTGPLDLDAGNLDAIYAVGRPSDGTLALIVEGDALQRLVNPLTPVRIADTRDGTGGVPTGRLVPGAVLRISVNDANGVPNTGAEAVALNVTAASPQADGYLTVYPCTDVAPTTSNVNYRGGQLAEPGAVIAALSFDGDVCIAAYTPTDVVVDLTAWIAGGSGFIAEVPERILDTRDGTGTEQAQLLPGEVLVVDVADGPGAGAAALNVTAANTGAPGYLTVYPCTEDVPYASNVNYEAGSAGSPNAVITALDGDGDACIATSAPTDVVVDLQGLFLGDATFAGTVPVRVYDTRDGTGGAPLGPLEPGEVAEVRVVDQAALVASGVNAVALNVTATEAVDNGYLTTFPCGGAPPYASSVNYSTAELSSPNAVITGIGPAGTVCITSSAAVEVVVDITGSFAA